MLVGNAKIKSNYSSYSFNRTVIPFPEDAKKVKPPQAKNNVIDSSHLFKSKEELPLEEQARQHMDKHRKAERIIMINFYTGGGVYKKGALDAIYRGFNPMNPGAVG